MRVAHYHSDAECSDNFGGLTSDDTNLSHSHAKFDFWLGIFSLCTYNCRSLFANNNSETKRYVLEIAGKHDVTVLCETRMGAE